MTTERIIIMNTDIKFQQYTTRFKDYPLKDLAQPEFAKGYLEAALQDFDKEDQSNEPIYHKRKYPA